jgi:hypothetical protein
MTEALGGLAAIAGNGYGWRLREILSNHDSESMQFRKDLQSPGGGAGWLAREADAVGDPSLRLKNGCARDDAGGYEVKPVPL